MTYTEKDYDSVLPIVRERTVRWLENRFRYLNEVLQEIKKAKTTSEFMKAKQELMYCLISSMPISSDFCPFCQLHADAEGDFDCSECTYAKKHDKCGIIYPDSTWRKLADARFSLLEAIKDYWHGDEFGACKKKAAIREWF